VNRLTTVIRKRGDELSSLDHPKYTFIPKKLNSTAGISAMMLIEVSILIIWLVERAINASLDSDRREA